MNPLWLAMAIASLCAGVALLITAVGWWKLTAVILILAAWEYYKMAGKL